MLWLPGMHGRGSVPIVVAARAPARRDSTRDVGLPCGRPDNRYLQGLPFLIPAIAALMRYAAERDLALPQVASNELPDAEREAIEKRMHEYQIATFPFGSETMTFCVRPTQFAMRHSLDSLARLM